MAIQGFSAGPPDDGAENARRDNCVVGNSQYRHEVWDEVDRRGQISQQNKEPPTHASWQGLVRGESADEPDHVG